MSKLYPGIPFSPPAFLVDNVGAADTIIKVSDVSLFPDAPNYATIGTDESGETIIYTAKTADSLSGCQRGVEGTAKVWSAGELIARNFTAADHADLIAAIGENATAAGAAKTAADNAQTTADTAKTAAGDAQTTADNAAAGVEAINKAKGAASGVATLDENGVLSGSQRPSATDMGAADLLLSNLSDPAAARWNLGAAGNTNLLDNWYFPAASVIDQRQGYVAPPNTLYYSDTGLTTQAGTVDDYTTAVYVNGTYGSITVDSVTYYVDWTAAVRGYVTSSNCYTIDRWRITANGTPIGILLEEGHIRLLGSYAGNSFAIYLDIPSRFAGQTVTLSLLCRGSGGMKQILINWGANKNYRWTPKSESDFELIQVTATLPDTVGALLGAVIYPSYVSDVNGDWLDVKAVKLELGGVQTLARQDGEGSWVLNDPPPDPALELLKCQRYFQVYSEEDKRPALAMDCRPAMRIDPTPLTLNINGQTCYANSAEL